MKKMSILALAAATLFGTLYADDEPVKDEPVATTTDSTEESEGTSVSFNDEEEVRSSFLANKEDEEGEIKTDSFLANKEDEEGEIKTDSFLANKEDEEGEIKTDSFLAANTDEEEKPVESNRIA